MARPDPTKIIGYLRTSTDDQRLGIEAQEATLQRKALEKRCTLDDHRFIEHESGGDDTRPELDAAFRRARRINAYVCVAKLDRLARDLAFLMKLADGDVPIIFGDLPDVDIRTPEGRLMVQQFGAWAEFERRRIGSRTKEALAVLKARGVKLGASRPESRNLTDEARRRGAVQSARNRVAKAIDQQSDVAAIALEKRRQGLSLGQIARHLNAEGYPTREGSTPEPDPTRPGKFKGGWTATQVRRVLSRLPSP